MGHIFKYIKKLNVNTLGGDTFKSTFKNKFKEKVKKKLKLNIKHLKYIKKNENLFFL